MNSGESRERIRLPLAPNDSDDNEYDNENYENYDNEYDNQMMKMMTMRLRMK